MRAFFALVPSGEKVLARALQDIRLSFLLYGEVDPRFTLVSLTAVLRNF